MRAHLVLFILLFSSCLTSPDFERTNIWDKNAGEPYIHNFQYKFSQNGLIFGWIDGSNDNDEYVITQKMYSNTDSLIQVNTHPGDTYLMLDNSGKYGFPYTVIINSNIKGANHEILKQISDTLSITFGEIEIARNRFTGDNLEITVFIEDFNPAIKAISFEILKSGSWSTYSENAPQNLIFEYPKDQLNQIDSLRFGIAVNDFNNQNLTVSSVTIPSAIN